MIMNVIVGVIVDSVNTSRQEVERVTLESLSRQIEELKAVIQNKDLLWWMRFPSRNLPVP